jgi:hypothetical protein
MNPRGSKLDPKLKLDMSFDEALTRFAQTKPKEVERSVSKAKQKKAAKPKKLSTR